MPKKKVHHRNLNPIKRLKKNHKGLHKLVVFAAIVVIWRGIWTTLDFLFKGSDPLIVGPISAGLALLLLLLDDFKFKELER